MYDSVAKAGEADSGPCIYSSDTTLALDDLCDNELDAREEDHKSEVTKDDASHAGVVEGGDEVLDGVASAGVEGRGAFTLEQYTNGLQIQRSSTNKRPDNNCTTSRDDSQTLCDFHSSQGCGGFNDLAEHLYTLSLALIGSPVGIERLGVEDSGGDGLLGEQLVTSILGDHAVDSLRPGHLAPVVRTASEAGLKAVHLSRGLCKLEDDQGSKLHNAKVQEGCKALRGGIYDDSG